MTPFDDLAIRFVHMASKTARQEDEKVALCQTFILVCIIKYSQMHKASEKFWNTINKSLWKLLEPNTLSRADYINLKTEHLEVKINYFGFIEELNRFGRIFDNKYHIPIPDYYVIRFYRNKMIEHRDEYWNYLQSTDDGLYAHSEKLIVPQHTGQKETPIYGQSLYAELCSEFQKSGVLFPASVGSMPQEDFAPTVFSHLALIDPQLRCGNGKDKISSDLVNILFKIGFPIPIQDIEEYCSRLVSWVEEFLGNDSLTTD